MRTRELGARFLDALLPGRCLHCGVVVGSSDWRPFLCAACSAALRYAGAPAGVPGVQQVRAVFVYAGPARTLVHALKYRGATALGTPLGRRLAVLLRGEQPGVVVPVPMHWRRRWRRGHNQAATLSRGLVRALPGWRHAALLRRPRATVAQVGLGVRQREANVRGALQLRRGSDAVVRHARLVVLDDVVTTGATLGEATRVLMGAGAGAVIQVAVAVAERHAGRPGAVGRRLQSGAASDLPASRATVSRRRRVAASLNQESRKR